MNTLGPIVGRYFQFKEALIILVPIIVILLNIVKDIYSNYYERIEQNVSLKTIYVNRFSIAINIIVVLLLIGVYHKDIWSKLVSPPKIHQENDYLNTALINYINGGDKEGRWVFAFFKNYEKKYNDTDFSVLLFSYGIDKKFYKQNIERHLSGKSVIDLKDSAVKNKTEEFVIGLWPKNEKLPSFDDSENLIYENSTFNNVILKKLKEVKRISPYTYYDTYKDRII